MRIKVSPFSNSASESSITRTLTESTHHIMDSAEKTELHRALSQQGILLGDLMDYGLDTRLGISSVALAEPISARTLCGTLLILYDYPTSNHAEEIRLLLIHSPTAPVALDHTWLVKHNPHIDWARSSFLAWSPFCLSQCLGAAFSPVMSCSVLQEKPVSLADVPEAYYDLRAVFSKS